MIEGIVICVALLIIELVILHFIDRRLDYAQLNHSYTSSAGPNNSPISIGSAIMRKNIKKPPSNDDTQ